MLCNVQRLLGERPLGGGTGRGHHQQQVAASTAHPCPVCGGRFTRPADLALHLGKVHDIKTDVAVQVDAAAAAGDGGAPSDPAAVAILHRHQIYRDRDAVHTSPAPAALSVK